MYNHSSDINLKDYMTAYKKRTAKIYSFLDTDANLASDNPSRFKKDLLERTKKLIMTVDDNIRDENCSMILIEKQQKISQQSNYQLKLINIDI